MTAAAGTAASQEGYLLQMPRTYLLIATAVAEVGIGLLLLVSPSLPLALLLGVDQASRETILVARVAGAALLALGIACWVGRFDMRSSAQGGLLIGVLTYDVATAVLLAYAGLVLKLLGIALWPAVLVDVALAVWCVVCLWDKPQDGDVGTYPDRKAARGDTEASGS
jgi:hypothetical protein